MTRGREPLSDEAWKALIERLEGLVARIERLVPATAGEPDWRAGTAFRWRRHARGGELQVVRHPHTIRFEDLKDIDEQKRKLSDNNAQFVAGRSTARSRARPTTC